MATDEKISQDRFGLVRPTTLPVTAKCLSREVRTFRTKRFNTNQHTRHERQEIFERFEPWRDLGDYNRANNQLSAKRRTLQIGKGPIKPSVIAV